MQVKDLTYQHHKNAPYFFRNLNFSLEAGKMHALHGKNGMGKTVLLNLLSQKYSPQAIIQGEIMGPKKSVLVNQRFDVMIADQFSFIENLKFAGIPVYPSPFLRLKQPQIDSGFIEKFHIDPSKPVRQLSGGQRQILALLMVLQKPTQLLLLDEPTATLDEQNALMVFEFLKALTLQKMTLLVVCHDRELINQYATGQHLQLELDASGSRQLRIN